MNCKPTAYHWLEMGIITIPIFYRSKRPALPSWQPYKATLPTNKEIESWYKTVSNIAVVCGHNNLVILDFDNPAAHDLWLETYGQMGCADTYAIRTGRGYHYYYYMEEVPPHTMKWQGGEVKSSGYCLTFPSTHPTGRKYIEVTPGQPIMNVKSIYDVLPESVFSTAPTRLRSELPSTPFNPWQPQPQANGRCDDINERVSILHLLPDAKPSSNGWYVVKCPLHNDRKASAWIDPSRNRFGCHKCVNGSLSVIDLYMEIHNVDLQTSISELDKMI